jgi:hypothetical protein
MLPDADLDGLGDEFGHADAAEGELAAGLAGIAAAVADAADMALLRSRVAALSSGMEAWRLTDHEFVAWVRQGLTEGRLTRTGAPPRLLPLAPPPAPPPAPAPAATVPRRPAARRAPPSPPPAAIQKAVAGRFTQASVKCGDPGHVQADGTNIAEGATTTFTVRPSAGGEALATVSAAMNGQAVRGLDWRPRRPRRAARGDTYEFVVEADGQRAVSSNRFSFHEYPAVDPETVTLARRSGRFGWTGRYSIKFGSDHVTVSVKIRLVNRLGAKPEPGEAQPPIGDPVSPADKAAMKADIESKLSQKVSLYRSACRFGTDCSCPVPVRVLVSFVESGEHHVVDLYQGNAQANALQWTRIRTRDNSWAHETGHLLGWFDEYPTGAVGPTPRWQSSAPTHVMSTGTTVPPEYAWDFRDWYASKSGEGWTAR